MTVFHDFNTVVDRQNSENTKGKKSTTLETLPKYVIEAGTNTESPWYKNREHA